MGLDPNQGQKACSWQQGQSHDQPPALGSSLHWVPGFLGAWLGAPTADLQPDHSAKGVSDLDTKGDTTHLLQSDLHLALPAAQRVS